MKNLLFLFFIVFLITGCTDHTPPLRDGVSVDIYPVVKQIKVKIEKNKEQDAYKKVINYVDQHQSLFFNEKVTLSSSTKEGEKLLKKVKGYLIKAGINTEYLAEKKDNKKLNRFDFSVEVLDYRVQTPLCKPAVKYYTGRDAGCAVESNLWQSKVHPENNLSRSGQ